MRLNAGEEAPAELLPGEVFLRVINEIYEFRKHACRAHAAPAARTAVYFREPGKQGVKTVKQGFIHGM
jgi:hypothetical protein